MQEDMSILTSESAFSISMMSVFGDLRHGLETFIDVNDSDYQSNSKTRIASRHLVVGVALKPLRREIPRRRISAQRHTLLPRPRTAYKLGRICRTPYRGGWREDTEELAH